MKYVIYGDDEKDIAVFKNEHDRDVCLDALEREHPDCNFLILTREVLL